MGCIQHSEYQYYYIFFFSHFKPFVNYREYFCGACRIFVFSTVLKSASSPVIQAYSRFESPVAARASRYPGLNAWGPPQNRVAPKNPAPAKNCLDFPRGRCGGGSPRRGGSAGSSRRSRESRSEGETSPFKNKFNSISTPNPDETPPQSF